LSLSLTFVLRKHEHMNALTTFLQCNWWTFAQQGRPLEITVREHKSKRSLEQNARLHALLTEIAEQAWVKGRQYDMETWKEFYRQKLIGTEEIEMPDGRRLERGISTTTLDVAAFSDFMDRLTEHATSELGVIFSQ
jgi:hypothetical protein